MITKQVRNSATIHLTKLTIEGLSVGSELLGLIVGVSDGDRVGDDVGLALGLAVGLCDGVKVGDRVGFQ